MTIELLQTIAIAAYIAAGVMLLTAAALFFLFNIPATIGILSGSTARKAIENIRHQNENGNVSSGEHHVNRSIAGLSANKSDNKNNANHEKDKNVVSTSKLSTDKLAQEARETTVLGSGANETTVLGAAASETTVLGAEPVVNSAAETTVLGAAPVQGTLTSEIAAAAVQQPQQFAASGFVTELDLIFSESQEFIE